MAVLHGDSTNPVAACSTSARNGLRLALSGSCNCISTNRSRSFSALWSPNVGMRALGCSVATATGLGKRTGNPRAAQNVPTNVVMKAMAT